MGRPVLPDVNTMIQAGFDPKTGLPIKMAQCLDSELKGNIKRIIRINDEQVCINRYKWYNLPEGLDSQLIERILYYRGQGAFFYMEQLDKFFFLPYTLEGEIDVYGRYTGITPLPFNGQMGANPKEQKPWIRGLVKKPLYSVVMNDMTWADYTDSCVLLSDYSKQLSQTVLPRQTLNEAIIDVESECIPYLRTALINSTGVQGMRVQSQDEYASVAQASKSVEHAALSGQKYIPVIGSIDFQDLSAGEVAKAEEFLMTMQSLDNFRLGTIGLSNGGLFQKKAHELQTEANLNMGGGIGEIMQDGLTNRQNFADIVNSCWGLGIWCEVSETEIGDKNMDGEIADELDQSGAPGEQPNGGVSDVD